MVELMSFFVKNRQKSEAVFAGFAAVFVGLEAVFAGTAFRGKAFRCSISHFDRVSSARLRSWMVKRF